MIGNIISYYLVEIQSNSITIKAVGRHKKFYKKLLNRSVLTEAQDVNCIYKYLQSSLIDVLEKK